MLFEVDGHVRRCYFSELKFTVLTPLEKRADGAGVGLACIIVFDVGDKELNERSAGLLASVIDEARQVGALTGG